MLRPMRHVRRQGSPFATHDVHRVSEYFDGELEPTYAFVQATWLPDAFESVDALAECIRVCDLGATIYMCDHLRQGAISVGARAFAAEAEAIAEAVVAGEWIFAATRTRMLLVRLTMARRWLKMRLAKFSNAAQAYRAVERPEADEEPASAELYG